MLPSRTDDPSLSRIRAGITKSVLSYRSSLTAAERRVVEQRLPPPWIEEIERRFNTSYIPSAEHVKLLDVLVDVVGPVRLRRYFAEVYLAEVSKLPLLRTLIEATLRPFGASPGRLAKVMPRAWQVLAKDTGRFEARVDLKAGTGRLEYSNLPPELSSSGSWVCTFAGVFDGFLEQCGARGVVEMADVDVSCGRATYVLGWDAG